MVFDINKTLIKLGANVVITFDKSFDNVLSISRFIDQVDGLTNTSRISREFSVSYDNVEWNIRYKLTDVNLRTYIDVSKPFHLKLFYTVVEKYDELPISINTFELVYEEKPIEEDIVETPKKGFNMLDEIEYNVDIEGISEFAEETEAAINYFINTTSPIEVLYFRHEPDMGTQDVFLNEWSIHNEKDRKCIKVVVDENSIPKRNIQFDEWGIDFEKFVIYIDKVYFEQIFGKDIKPRNNDYAFFQKANRMYYVFSNELVTGANEGAPHYELALKKYDEDTSMKKSEDTQEFLEEKTITHDELFGEQKKDEMEDMSNSQQNLTKYISEDNIREEISELMHIVEERVYNNKIELMKSYYDLTMIPDNELAVKYRKKHEINTGGGWSVIAWIKKFEANESIKFDIVSQRRIDTYHIQLELSESNSLLKINEDNYIKRDNKIYYVEELIDDTNIKILSRDFVDELLLDDFQKLIPINIITSIDIDATFRVDVLETDIFIRFNNKLIRFNNVPFVDDEWMAVVINISNTHKYVGAYLWQMNETPDDNLSTALVNLYEQEYIIDHIIVVGETQPFIVGSNSNYGNLRVFKQTIGKEYHSYIASHRVLKKPSTAFIIDDAQVVFNYPKLDKGNMGTDLKEM